MKNNIINLTLVSLNDKFTKAVSEHLSDRLDMRYADCYDLVVYDLIDPKEVLQKCGLEYLKKRERAVIKNCSQYLNTVLTINYDLYRDNIDLFDSSLVIYLQLPEEKVSKVVNKIDYSSRDEFLSKNCDLIVHLNKCLSLTAVKNILEKLGDVL